LTKEGKVLRQIIGPIQDKDHWRVRYNKELYKIFKEPEISTVMKLKRLHGLDIYKEWKRRSLRDRCSGKDQLVTNERDG
jgi:hypothetical protein